MSLLIHTIATVTPPTPPASSPRPIPSNRGGIVLRARKPVPRTA